MAEGSVFAIQLAFALMLMPQAAIAQSVATAAMPTLSAQYAQGLMNELRSTLAASLRGMLLLAIPASLGLILLREPLIVLLFQRGEFTAQSTELVAWALLWYALGLVGHCLVELLARAFYALHDTRTPVAIGVVIMSLNVLFSIALLRPVHPPGLGAARRAGAGEHARHRPGSGWAAGLHAPPAEWAGRHGLKPPHPAGQPAGPGRLPW